MIIRNIQSNDYHLNYFDLLSQLTTVNKEKITFNKFDNFIKTLNDNHFIKVILIDNKIVASGTLFIEQKIIHGMAKVGHIEDIVVDNNCRGKGLGKRVVILVLLCIFSLLNLMYTLQVSEIYNF